MGFSSARNLGRDISAGFSPPRRMPISEAVKKFMRVPKGAGNSVPWDPELTPYIIEPMNCLASREYDAVIFVGPARTGKTIGLIDGWIVYTIVCDPSDMLVVQMTEDKAREHSKKRLDRTFRSSAAVKKRMSPRRNDNNVHDKTFRDGSFLKIGWPSVNIMSSSDFSGTCCTAVMAYVPSSFSRILTQRNRRWRNVGNFSPHTLYSATPSGTRLTFTFTPSVTDWTSTLTGFPEHHLG